MSTTAKRALFWAPRILTILLAAFLSLLAVDVPCDSRGFWPTAVALLLHLIPTFAVVITLIVAWRWEWVGAAVLSLFAILYSLLLPHSLVGLFVISGYLALLGVLFFLNWMYRAQVRQR
jgi:hypothetical protein